MVVETELIFETEISLYPTTKIKIFFKEQKPISKEIWYQVQIRLRSVRQTETEGGDKDFLKRKFLSTVKKSFDHRVMNCAGSV